MATKNQSQSFPNLDSFCQRQSYLRTKIAYITFYNIKYPAWTEMLLVIIEYFQLISQALLLRPSLYENSSTEGNFLFRRFIDFFKSFDLSSFVSFQKDDTSTSIILLVLFLGTIFKLGLFAYVALLTFSNAEGCFLLIKVWRFVFKIQTRILFYFMTSFWVQALVASSNEEFSSPWFSHTFVITIAIVMITLETLFTLMIETQLNYVLPTKNFLACQNNNPQFITFSQKLSLQILIMSFRSDSIEIAWVYNVFNLIFCLFRGVKYYTTLPLYNTKALFFQGDLLNIVFSLNIVCFFQTLLESFNYGKADIKFLIILWIILSILMMKLFRGLLSFLIINILLKPVEGPPEYLVHKVQVAKQIKKQEKLPGESSNNYDWNYFLCSAESVHRKAISTLTSRSSVIDFSNKKTDDLVYLQYIEDGVDKYPNNILLKLYLAYMCSKKSALYAKAIKIAIEQLQYKWSMYHLTSSFLLYEVEKTIMNNYNKGDVNLDVFAYIKSENMMSELKREMLKQVDLKIKICNNILGEVCDIGEIYDCAQIIVKSKQLLRRKMNYFLKNIPDHNFDPLLVCAEYQLILNYSQDNYFKYHETFTQKYFKYEKHFKGLNLIEENLYQENNAFLLLSGPGLNNGKVLFCTKGMNTLCGRGKSSYIGSFIPTIFPKGLQSFYQDFFKQILDKGDETFLNRRIRAFIAHKDKYMIETEFYLRVHPYVTQNLNFNMIIRPVPSSKHYIMIREDGEIEGITKKLANILKVREFYKASAITSINVKYLSHKLSKINEAFNIVHRNMLAKNTGQDNSDKIAQNFQSNLASKKESQKDPVTLNYDKALEIYSMYTSEGKKLELMPIMTGLDNNALISSSNYHCKVEIQMYGSVFMKLVTLEETSKNDCSKFDTCISYEEKMGKLDKLSMNNAETFEKESGKDFDDSCSDIAAEEVLNNDKNEPLTTRPDKITTTEANCLFQPEENQGELPLTSTRALVQPVQNEEIPVSASSSVSSDGPRIFKKQRNKDIPKYVISHHSSQTPQEKNSNKIYRKAITMKSYPKTFIILCIVFYGVILFTLITQALMTNLSNSTMSDLVVKKNLLKYAQFRMYKAILIQVNARGTALQLAGRLAHGGIILGVDEAVGNFHLHLSDLLTSNKEILGGANTLDQMIQEKLFDRDVRINGSYIDDKSGAIQNVTNFQSVEIYGSAIQSIISMENRSSYEGLEVLEFLTHNILDDFLTKTLEVTQLFLDSVNDQKEFFQDTIILCLVVTPLSLGGIGLILTKIIWKQYNTERNYLSGFIKLKPSGVEHVLSNFVKFRECLINENSFKNKDRDNNIEEKNLKPAKGSVRLSFRTNNIQEVVYLGMRRRYSSYTLKFFIYLVILLGIMLWNFISALDSTNIIYLRMNQLQFANYISSRTSVSYVTYVELFASNNTLKVEGQTPLASLTSTLEEMKKIRTNIPKEFREEDKTYDPEVKAILYDNDGCHRFITTTKLHCNAIAANGLPTNLLPLIAAYENSIINKMIDYQNVDKSTMGSILAVGAANLNSTLPLFTVIANEAYLIGEIINKNMSESIDRAFEQRTLFLLVFSLSLFVVSLLIWSQILVRLREVNNDFKKVLQVFPPNLILSSFLLKNFLKEASRGIQL